MTARPKLNPTAALRPWLLPLCLASVGAWGWACQDDGPDDSSNGDRDDDDDGPDDADGPGSVTEPDDASGRDDATAGGSDVSRRDVLWSIGTRVIAPATAEFATQATALDAAVQLYATRGSEDSRATARDAWREAALDWQQLEVMQVGPAASSLVGIGGEDLRDAIYSWPTTDSCSIDRVVAGEDYLADDFFVTELVWSYGLDALEYLLFNESTAHTCPAQVQLDGPWAALGTDELARRRAAYAGVVAGGIAARAGELAERWASDGGSFGALLADQGAIDSPYANEAEAMDEVFRAIFYIAKITKDAKLGIPIGIVAGCSAPPCIGLMETPFSGDAATAMRANLEGLALMVKGGPDAATADGFDDLLRQMGEDQIADDLLAAIDVAIAATEAYDTPLQAELAADPEALDDLYAAIKGVTDILKGPFVMALMLTVPADGGGDLD